MPTNLKNVIQISAGGEHVLALKADGTVVAWGWNSEGQCNVPQGLKKVVQVSAGNVHSVALQADGSLVAWGGNGYNQSNPPSSLTNITQISAGFGHTLALRKDGTVGAWGYNLYGQSTLPQGLKNVVQVAAGDNHSVALFKDGTVSVWGFNSQGQRNIPGGLKGITQIEGGGGNTLAIGGDGSLVAWGANESGQSTVPRIFAGTYQFAAGSRHVLALQGAGTVAAWGANDSGQCNVPGDLPLASQVAAGYGHSVALLKTGKVIAWGQNDGGQCDVPSTLSGVKQVAAGALHTLALKSDGTVVAWGYNGNGQCTIPAKAVNVVQVAAGGYHSLALLKDGTVIGWGSNQNNEITVPSGLKDVTQISSRYFHSLALKKDGLVVAWGSNSQGQTNVPAPLKNVSQIAAGAFHSVALKTDQTVSAWSNNASGESTIPSGLAGISQVDAGDSFSIALPSISLGVSRWQENQGGTSTGTITLASAPKVDTDVPVEASSLLLIVPSLVTVPAGERSATFSIGLKSAFQGTATLRAKYLGSEAVTTLTVTGLSTIKLTPDSVKGGTSSTGTLTLSGPAPLGGINVGIASTNAAVTVPARVTIAEGKSTATFNIGTSPTATDFEASIIASVGVSVESATLKVLAPRYSAFTVSPAEVKGGASTTATVTIDSPAPAGGLKFDIYTNPWSSAQKSVTIEAGKTTASFDVQTEIVSEDRDSSVTANLGTFSRTAKLKILAPTLVGFSMNPGTLKGGGTSTGTVRIDGAAPTGGIIVKLLSDSSIVSVPISATIPAGKTSTTFLAATAAVSKTTNVNVTASVGKTTLTQLVRVQAPSVTAVSLNPTSVLAGEKSTGTVTISNPAPIGGLAVALVSNHPSLVVTANAVIPEGKTEGTFNIQTRGVSDLTVAKVTASFENSSASASLTINPPVLTSISIDPKTVKGDDEAVGTVTIATPAPAGGTVVTLTSDSLAADVPFSIGIAEGQKTVSFAINTRAVTAQTVATIRAKLGTVTLSDKLTIQAPRLISLGLTVSKVVGGTGLSGVVVLDAPAPAGGLRVTLTSSDTAAKLPSSTTIPAGSYLANFSITTSKVSATIRATITAKLGTSGASATVQITR